MKNIKIIFKILIISTILLFTTMVNHSKASFWSEIFESADNFLETGEIQAKNETISASDAKTKEVVNDLYNILFPLGIVVTVIVGGVLGIKFMMASAEDKAKVKESMVPYVAGCVVIYGAFGIWKIAIEIFSAIS